MPERATRSITIVVAGRCVHRLASSTETAMVVAAFARSIHIAVGEHYACIGRVGIGRVGFGEDSIGNGPLNAMADAAGAASLAAYDVGDPIHLDLSEAARWSPPLPSQSADPARLGETLDALRTIAAVRAPADGLARPALGLAGGDPATQRVAGSRLRALHAWIDGDGMAEPPVSLLGLGPGLTPSGDDVLCGALIALHATGGAAMAHRLGDAAVAAASAATTPLSRAMLTAAAAGEAAEALHLAVNDIMAGRAAALPGRVAALAGIGHTSGWDALAGAAMALDAALYRISQASRQDD